MSLFSKIQRTTIIGVYVWDVLGCPEVKNLSFNAGVMGLIPGWGTKIPHALEQLSVHAATTDLKPQLESLFNATKSPHDAMNILHALTNTRCSQVSK